MFLKFLKSKFLRFFIYYILNKITPLRYFARHANYMKRFNGFPNAHMLYLNQSKISCCDKSNQAWSFQKFSRKYTLTSWNQKRNFSCYSQTRWTVATRLSFWHLFDKFLISLMASSCTTVYRNDLWNVQFQLVLQTQKTFPVRKVKFDQIFVGIKFIYRQLNFCIIARAKRCLKPFQTLTFEDESCNGWFPAFHFSRHLIGSLKQPEAVKLIKVIKNLSKRCQKLCWVATVECVWL